MDLSTLGLRVATRRPLVALIQRIVRAGAISQGGALLRAVALTFDDGPHPRFTPRILDILDAHSAKATFFVVGRNVAACPELVCETRRRGHDVGTHLYSHDRSAVIDGARFRDELARSSEQLASLLGEAPRFIRFPYGERGRQRPRAIRQEHGLKVVHWTFSAHDGYVSNPEAVARRVDAGVRPGAIVLLHDRLADEDSARPSRYAASREATVSALPRILQRLAERRLRAVTLTDLLQ